MGAGGGNPGVPAGNSTVDVKKSQGLDYVTGEAEVLAGKGTKPLICTAGEVVTEPEPVTNNADINLAVIPCEPEQLLEVLQSSIETHYTGYINVYAWEDIDPNKFYAAQLVFSNITTGEVLSTVQVGVPGSANPFIGRQFAASYYDFTIPANQGLAIAIDFQV